MKRLTSFLFLCFLPIIAWGQAAYTLFEKANKLYNNGSYIEAIENYTAILDTGEHSAELYYNLANTYYKLNEIAPSIYYYEKALLLNPSDVDIINNLSFAQNMTLDAIDVVPEFGATKAIRTLSNSFTTDQWALLSVCFVFLLFLSVLLYIINKKAMLKRLFFIGSLVCILLSSSALVMAFHSAKISAVKYGIVFSEEAKILSDPNLSSNTIFVLHEGTKVKVVERYNSYWIKIKLSDGKVGWAILEDIKLL